MILFNRNYELLSQINETPKRDEKINDILNDSFPPDVWFKNAIENARDVGIDY